MELALSHARTLKPTPGYTAPARVLLLVARSGSRRCEINPETLADEVIADVAASDSIIVGRSEIAPGRGLSRLRCLA
jgi:hypothetical protein